MLPSDVIKNFHPAASPSRKAMCAVSGGVDSVFLLHELIEAGYRKVVVCHFNHRARGRESLADERFVRRLAARLGLEVEIGRAAASGGGTEASWREERYRFMLAAAKRRRCRAIFLGHTADDQAETVLWNLLRGSGMKGLGGMAEAVERDGVWLLRPLLGIFRAAIEAEALRRGLKFRKDSSNENIRYARNALRLVIIPELERLLRRNVRTRIVSAAAIIREEDGFLSDLAQEAVVKAADDAGSLKRSVVEALPVALQRRVIGLWLEGLGLGGIGFDQIEDVRSLMACPRTGGGPSICNLPGDFRARRKAGRVFVERIAQPRGVVRGWEAFGPRAVRRFR